MTVITETEMIRAWAPDLFPPLWREGVRVDVLRPRRGRDFAGIEWPMLLSRFGKMYEAQVDVTASAHSFGDGWIREAIDAAVSSLVLGRCAPGVRLIDRGRMGHEEREAMRRYYRSAW